MKALAVLLFAIVILFAFKSGELTGTQSAMVVPRPLMSNDWNGFELKDTRIEKCVILGDTMKFDAASEVRCDSLYKYYQLIGYGEIVGCKGLVYLYRLNCNNAFMTKEEVIAYIAEKK